MTDARALRDGREEGLVALESLDLDRVKSFSSLLRAMSKTAFGGRSLGEAFDVTVAMVKDPDCKVVLTLSGAMTIAKMGKVISKMIDTGMVQAVVSTGALMAHGMSEAVGLTHYRHDPKVSDEELFEKGYNRVYDTLEMESNLNYVEAFTSKALDRLAGEGELSSEIVNRTLGQVLAEDPRSTGVLRSAYLKGVPVYVPAFTDSELGLDLATWAMKKVQARGVTGPLELFDHLPRYNPFLDLNSFARLALAAKKLGIFTIGGGVPRNWAQEVGPYIDITNHRLGRRPHAPALHLRRAHLPRARALGRPLGLHVLRGGLVGQVRAAVRGRPLRRGLRRRDDRLAAAHEGRPRGAGALVAAAGSSVHGPPGRGSRPRRGRRRPLLLGGQRPALRPLPRRGVGLPRRRRPAALREDLPRGLPGGPELADHPPEARELPCRLPGIRPRGGGPLRRARRRRSPRPAVGPPPPPVARFGARDVARLLKDAGIVRHRGKIESDHQQRPAGP